MSTTLFLNYFAFFGFAITESAIITTPLDVSKCAGQDVILQWEYDNPTDLQIATWTFSNDTVNGVIIMQEIVPADPAAPSPAPLSVQFIENGTIKLFDTSSINTGRYRFAVLYGVETAANSEVDIAIHDAPQALTFQEVTTNTFSCSGSSSIPTVIRVTSKDGVSLKTSPYTRSDTRERIECCYNGIAANCSTEEFDYVNGTLYCKLVKEADPWYIWCLCNLTECILAIVIPLLIGIGCMTGAIFYCCHKGKCCFDKPRNLPCCPRKNGRETGPLPGDQRTRRNNVKPSPDARPNQRPQPNPPDLLKSEKDQDSLPSIGTKPSPDARPSQRPQPEPSTLLMSEKDQDPLPSIGTKPSPDARSSQRPQPNPPTLLKSEKDQDPLTSIGTRSNGKPEGDQRSGVPYKNVLSNLNEHNNQITSQKQPVRLDPIKIQPEKRKKKGKSKRLEPEDGEDI